MFENRDTVEEFWSLSDVDTARENASDTSVENFLCAFGKFLGVHESRLQVAPSGKAALEGLLKARKDRRPVVMVPALNCVRVKEAIEAANCEVQTYDFEFQPGRFNWDIVLDSITDQVGVLIVTHLYGVPVDLRKARDFCNAKGILLIEDCAQTLGGYIDGRQVGTWGDAAIFSFSYDKPISLGWGGIAIINSQDMFQENGNAPQALPTIDPSYEYDLLINFMKSMNLRRSRINKTKKGMSSIFRRAYYRFSRAPTYDVSTSIGSIRAELGILCLERYPKIRSIRNANAEIFSSKCSLVSWPVMQQDIQPAWLKQKVFVGGPAQLNSISIALCKRGIRAGNFNWPELITGNTPQSAPNANQVTSCWMYIPIHQKLKVSEIENIISVIREHL